jgi:class 3 adenylate cyclase
MARRGTILVSETVFDAVRERARAKGPVQLKLKGKEDPLNVYQLLALRGRAKL